MTDNPKFDPNAWAEFEGDLPSLDDLQRLYRRHFGSLSPRVLHTVARGLPGFAGNEKDVETCQLPIGRYLLFPWTLPVGFTELSLVIAMPVPRDVHENKVKLYVDRKIDLSLAVRACCCRVVQVFEAALDESLPSKGIR